MQNADQLRAELSSISDLLRNGRAERAFKRATKAAKKWPKVSAFPMLAGLSAIQQQKFKLAQAHLQRAWRMEPGNAELTQNYAMSMVQGGDAEEALRFIAKVAGNTPIPPALQYIRAMALVRVQRNDDALSSIEQIIEKQPGNLQAQCLKAEILDDMRKWDQSVDVLTALVEKHPKFHYGQLSLAKAHVGLGNLDLALTHARSALSLAPGHPDTVELLASLPNLTQADRDGLQTQVSKALGTPSSNREAAAMIHFAAAGLAKKNNDTAQEMAHLADAHALLREGYQGWDERSRKECRNRLASPLPALNSEPQADTARPIFVLGLPRSGTTLVERILASHSKVQGLGELGSVHQWARQVEGQKPSEYNAQDLADFYSNLRPELANTTEAFVDKAPGNYAFIGAMTQAFPNAVILNVQRDPRDIALSMWRSHFGAGGLFFTHDFKWMAAEANRYRQYIQHWHQLLPGRVHDIQYETLVSDLEPTVRELAQICGLSFENRMLSPEESSDAVKTASNLQVRKPVSSASVGGWQAVADQLEPFVKGLDTELWPDVRIQS